MGSKSLGDVVGDPSFFVWGLRFLTVYIALKLSCVLTTSTQFTSLKLFSRCYEISPLHFFFWFPSTPEATLQ